ncbi:TPA: hypothetical protein N0F65_003723 [Lagenidium giganteum]|uniref:HTH CENPB-type domain-containing protein n=1 Tax=Lagenidium giganteum TaxID=4803 RepID=A0AAV2Z3L8_9STRA|nr:TPA: hypothetical protein N0F65_003723 [Lagenidium giganteum]
MGRRRADELAANPGTAMSARPARAGMGGARGRMGGGNGNLTNHQRKVICEFYQKSGGVMSQKDLAQWTKHEFGLKKTPAQSTISGILRRKHEFINMSTLELNIKKRRVVQHPMLDNALANWVIQCAHRGVTVQGDMTKEKAKHFAKMLNIPEEEQPEFSNGWLHSFQLRHNFSFRKFNGETNTDSKKVIYFSSMEALLNETTKYELSNIYCMEEVGILYKLPPFQTIEDPWLLKKRIVVALCANADGSDKIEPLFVSHHEQPRCFKKKTAEQHELHYFWNSKAWMTGVIFSRWIQRLDAAMASQKRHILLFLSDAPSHVVAHLELTNIVIFFLPAGAAQTMNPLASGIAATVKKRFRRLHLERAAQRLEEEKKNPFDIDVLQAMKWAASSWREVSKESIQLGWAATQILGARVALPEIMSNEHALLEAEITQHMHMLRLPADMLVPLETYTNDEARCTDPIHEEFFEVIEAPEDVPDDDAEDEVDEAWNPALSQQEKLKALRDVLQVLKERNEIDDGTMSTLRRVQEALKDEQGSSSATADGMTNSSSSSANAPRPDATPSTDLMGGALISNGDADAGVAGFGPTPIPLTMAMSMQMNMTVEQLSNASASAAAQAPPPQDAGHEGDFAVI